MSEDSIPVGWVKTSLGTVASWGSGGTPSRANKEYFSGDIPWIKTGELGPKFIRSAEEKLSTLGIEHSAAKVFPAGSVGIAMYGATIGKLSIWAIDASTNQACAVAWPISQLLFNEFLYYYLLSQHRGFVEAGKGGAQPNISQGVLKDWPICLPPLSEQRRIVAKIEELLSELDKGIENLKKSRAQLLVYRQALLKHAFEGKLTAGWRKAHYTQLELTDQLVARLRAERQARYKKQLSEWESSLRAWSQGGENGPKPNKPREPKELRPIAAEVRKELAELPPSWAWDVLGWSTNGVEYGSAAKSSKSGTHVVLRMGNLQRGKLDWSDLAFSNDADEVDQYLLNPGDVLFNRTNSPEWVGKSAIYRGERPALFAGYLIRINHSAEAVRGEYLNWFLNSPVAKQYGNTVKTDGVNQSNINGDKLMNYPFPYCSLAEQGEIVRILEELVSLIDRSAEEIEMNLQKAESLRQSIFRKSFAGELVPQDPADEPAAAVLARIGVERIAQCAVPKSKKRHFTKV
jgi:type I restriction enzyme S subunit